MYAIIGSAVVIALALVYVGYGLTQGNTASNTQDYQQEINDQVVDKNEPVEDKNTNNSAGSRDLIEDDAVLGDPNAPVTMVEFSDYDCPFCTRFYSETLPEIKEKYIETGKVKFVYRDFPLEKLHPNAWTIAMATECAGEQGMFFEMHNLVFDTPGTKDADTLKSMASELGLDTASFNSCLDNEETRAEVEKDMQDGMDNGVQGTPAFFVNDVFVSGAQPFNEFEKLIEAELGN